MKIYFITFQIIIHTLLHCIEKRSSTGKIDSNNTDAHSVPACESDVYVSKCELGQFHESYGFHLGPALTEDMRYDVLKMLYMYRQKTVFARDVSEIKLAKGPPLKIDLHTNRMNANSA